MSPLVPSWMFDLWVLVFIVIPPLVLLAAEVWERYVMRALWRKS